MKALSSKIILLVEDDALTAMAGKVMLEKNGYTVISAPSGEKAIDIIHENSGIDLILMDIDLGSGMDGTECAEIILKRKDIPILFLSSHTEPEIVEKTEKITSYGYVVKNSGDVVLLASIRMAFRLFQAHRETREKERLLLSMALNYPNSYVSIIEEDYTVGFTSGQEFFRQNLDPSRFVGKTMEQVFGEHAGTVRSHYEKTFSGEEQSFELFIFNQHQFYRTVPLRSEDGRISRILSVVENITDRKKVENERNLVSHLLEIAGRQTLKAGLFRELCGEIQGFTGCQCVGIRLLHKDGRIPYEGYVGFPESFYRKESPLSIRKDRCMCIYVLTETVDISLPFITDRGSFYMNGTTRFLATVSQDEKGDTRNTCNAYGFESVALIPIRLNDEILALIHLADRREDMVPLDLVRTMERVGASLGASIRRVMAEDELSLINERLLQSQAISHVGNWEYNLETGEIWGSDEAVRIYRLPPDVNGFPIDEIEACIPERERVHQALMDLIEHEKEYDLVFAINPADGTEQRIISSCARLIRDESGNPVKVAGVIQDITERMRIEDTVKRQLQEKELLLKEVHHRIKNNLSTVAGLLSFHAGDGQNISAGSILHDAIGRVQSMRMIYDRLLLSDDFRVTSAKLYFEELIDAIVLLYPHKNDFRIEKRIEDLQIDVKRLSPLGIIINELITNAMKYAFQGNSRPLLKIELFRKENRITLTVHDNGISLPQNFNINDSRGLGLKLIRMLAEQLRGTFSLRSDNGTLAILKFEA